MFHQQLCRIQWDKGSGRNNFEEVFGRNVLMWLIPVNTEIGSGYHFINPYVEESGRLLEHHEDTERSGDTDAELAEMQDML